MEYTNKLVDLTKKQGGIDKETMETIVTLLSPFAPHVAEELWEVLGHNQSIFESTQWPSFDEEKMKDNEIEMAVQVNGKVKAKVTLSVDETKESALAKAKGYLRFSSKNSRNLRAAELIGVWLLVITTTSRLGSGSVSSIGKTSSFSMASKASDFG